MGVGLGTKRFAAENSEGQEIRELQIRGQKENIESIHDLTGDAGKIIILSSCLGSVSYSENDDTCHRFPSVIVGQKSTRINPNMYGSSRSGQKFPALIQQTANRACANTDFSSNLLRKLSMAALASMTRSMRRRLELFGVFEVHDDG